MSGRPRDDDPKAGGAPRARDRARAHDHDGGDLEPVDRHLERILDAVEPLPPVDTPLVDAAGGVPVTDVLAPRDLPTFASSAMDGFAARSGDVAGAAPGRPVPLRIAGRSVPGALPDVAVERGAAVAIATGAPVPQGADCVVPIEACAVDGERVLVFQRPAPGEFVRPAGQDVRGGEVLVPAGRPLLAGDLGLLALAGLGSVAVRRRPRVAIVSTGDELVPPGARAAPGQVHDANATTLAAQVREAGAVSVATGIVPDDPAALAEALALVAATADVIVTSGGVSVGERDPVTAVLGGSGDVSFSRVAIQPGMPQAFGRVHDRLFFGLPGNPVSVFVSFEVFVRPALLAMAGRRRVQRTQVRARLATGIEGPASKRVYVRVRLREEDGSLVAEPTGGRQSNLLATVARADGLAIIPEGVERLRASDPCGVLVFRDAEER